MSIEVTFQKERQQYAIICTIKDMWTWTECREALQTMVNHHLEFEPAEVNYIFDISESKIGRRDLTQNMRKLLEIEFNPMPKRIILIERGMYLQMMGDTLLPLDIQVRPFIVNNLNQAIRLMLVNQ